MLKIILVGYMGSGKSTVGYFLSEKLQVPLIDLDCYIEEMEEATINSIFETKGEIYFRKIEHQVVASLASSSDSFVLSLGGGTPCYANNHLFLRGDGVISIYLKTSKEELIRRLEKETLSRPILADKETAELKEFIAQHLFERSYYYQQSMYTVVTDGKTPAELGTEIETLLT